MLVLTIEVMVSYNIILKLLFSRDIFHELFDDILEVINNDELKS